MPIYGHVLDIYSNIQILQPTLHAYRKLKIHNFEIDVQILMQTLHFKLVFWRNFVTYNTGELIKFDHAMILLKVRLLINDALTTQVSKYGRWNNYQRKCIPGM